MDDFVERVKEKLLQRYEKNFDASEANGSLFGFLIGGSGKYHQSRLYFAKGDVMVEYGATVPTVTTPAEEFTGVAVDEDTSQDRKDVTRKKA